METKQQRRRRIWLHKRRLLLEEAIVDDLRDYDYIDDVDYLTERIRITGGLNYETLSVPTTETPQSIWAPPFPDDTHWSGTTPPKRS